MEDYQQYIRLSTLTNRAAQEQRRTRFFPSPRFVLVQTEPGGTLQASLQGQTYRNFVLTDLSRRVEGDYYLFLPGEGRLQPEALFRLAMGAQGGADLLYADEDVRIGNRRTRPAFKPDYSPHTLLCRDYLGRGVCLSRWLLKRLGTWPGPGPGERYACWLKAAELSCRVEHVPFLLFSLPPEEGTLGPEPVDRALRRRGQGAMVLPGPIQNSFLPRLSVPGEPLVSIIVVHEGSDEQLKATLLALEQRMQLPRFQFLVPTGGPLTPFLLALREAGIPVLEQPGAPLGALLQAGAQRAGGRFLLFVRPGCLPLSPDYAQRLTEWAQAPAVGAVGPLVLDGQERLLNWGTVLGQGGGLGSPGQGLPFSSAKAAWPHWLCPRDVSALSYEALLLRRDRLFSVGGFCRDMDLGALEELCLRLRQKGLFCLCAPGVRFMRTAPAVSRPQTRAQEQRCRDAFYPLLLRGDPFFNPNLSLLSPVPRPALPPRPPLTLHAPGVWEPIFEKNY